AGTASRNIIIEQRTALGTLLWVVIVICGSIMAASLLLRMIGISGIPAWLAGDCGLGFLLAGFLLRFVRSRYTFDPSTRNILHEQVTPLYVRRRNVSFDEVRAVSVRGELGGWPLLFHFHYLELQTVLVFDSGIVLPVYDPVRATNNLWSALEIERARAERLAQILDCPLFPEQHLDAGAPNSWNAEVRRLREHSAQPDELEKALVETYVSSLGMCVTGPQKVKIDLTTKFEKFVLAFVVSFFAVTTWYALSAEWTYLAGNPRIFYLILLDCTSVVVTVLGLWRWLVDEFYLFDIEKDIIEFHSRWGFWKTSRVISSFGDVRDIRINRVWALFARRLEYTAELKLPGQDRITISDHAPSPGIPVFRALVLSRLIGRHLRVDPNAFERSVEGAPALVDEQLRPRTRRQPDRLSEPPGLPGGLLPVETLPQRRSPRRRRRR
ncbi:MAG TPA: hypothetical protein PKM25_17120, partial [Candidatus Ozemobacteraceae bacterium]|nr:hypothetical protein [Candidatus Ozemobacteraceae bacterium]